MDALIQNLDIVFRRIQPETVFREMDRFDQSQISANNVAPSAFRISAHTDYDRKSHEEIDGIYQMLQTRIKTDQETSSVFRLLLEAADKFLYMDEDALRCKYEHILDWQELYLNLGQDLFTTAFRADSDIKNCIHRKSFEWETVIRTDSRPLHQQLKNGLVENHCHLNGSSQTFSLNWAYAMNHPQKIHGIIQQLGVNLQGIERRRPDEAGWSWEERLQYAALIRQYLYRKKYVQQEDISETLKADVFGNSFYSYSALSRDVDYLRYVYGLAVDVPGHGKCVLDYALDKQQANIAQHHNRVLSGERGFLYHCFRRIFGHTFSDFDQNLLYIYLLIKSNFRSEIIQVNREYGFTNFREYQDRKEIFFTGDSAYEREMVRLAVQGNMQDYPIKRLEARFSPAKSWKEFQRKIREYDGSIDIENNADHAYFYAMHFIKSSDFERYKKNQFLLEPRNYKVRNNAEKQANALCHALSNTPSLRNRIMGADAASTEVGCRPETFSAAFRTLRNHVSNEDKDFLFCGDAEDNPENPANGSLTCRFLETKPNSDSQYVGNKNKSICRLGKTYHAGEDFCDMIDGMRAIDEAIQFLKMKRGDRIGHALALGVSPYVHYKAKDMCSILTKQDHLDNLVWALTKVNDWGIPIDASFRDRLKREANLLIGEIYGNELAKLGISSIPLSQYYQSWLLRQDPPEWYLGIDSYNPICRFEKPEKVKHDEELETIRKNKTTAALCGLYHYSAEVRYIGMERMELTIEPQYMKLVEDLQNAMQYDIAAKGICIECNPTSNYLIGTFRDYRLHPIFRFFPVKEDENHRRWLQVSINTDDIGVFDTSLENEYVVIAAALQTAEDDHGKRLYTDEEIARYLETIRQGSFNQSFVYNES